MPVKSKLEEILRENARLFRKNYNTDGDYLFVESTCFKNGLLFVSYSREYDHGIDQSGYSLIYVFNRKGNKRIYYEKISQGNPAWNKPELFLQTITKVTNNRNVYTLFAKTANGLTKTLTHTV